MPGVDRECTTHHACDCIQAKLERLMGAVAAAYTPLVRYRNASANKHLPAGDTDHQADAAIQSATPILAEMKERYDDL